MVEKKYSWSIVRDYGWYEFSKGVATGMAVAGINSFAVGILNLYNEKLNNVYVSVGLSLVSILIASGVHPKTKLHKSLSDTVSKEIEEEIEQAYKDYKDKIRTYQQRFK